MIDCLGLMAELPAFLGVIPEACPYQSSEYMKLVFSLGLGGMALGLGLEAGLWSVEGEPPP